MSEEYDRFIADLVTNAPGALPTTIDAEVMITLRDFLQMTSAWRQDFELPVRKDRTCYVITPPRGAMIYLLFNIYRATDPDKRPVASAGWRMNAPGQIEFAAAPNEEELWVASVSLYPVSGSQGTSGSCRGVVPGHILMEYYDTLFHGVLSRLQAQPLKGYTNLPMAQMHQKLYREGRSIAKANIARSHVWGTQQWRFPIATTATTRQRGA